MKDLCDNEAIDAIPRKRGRPPKYPDRGPMTSAERRRERLSKLRRYGKVREVPISDKNWARLEKIAEREGVSRYVILSRAIKAMKLPPKKKQNKKGG